MAPIKNLRIHFYGVQGSGSVFPSYQERLAVREDNDLKLLELVFNDLDSRANEQGRLDTRVEDLLGGPVSHKTLLAYRQRFELEEPRIYGGWTTCFHIETGDGYDIVIDCGSGFRNCAKNIVEKWGNSEERELFILGSHSHFDHTEGFDQAAVCFDPRNKIHIMANRTYLRALDQNLGIFSRHVEVNLKGVQTPLSYELMPAQFDSCEIRDFKTQPPDGREDKLANRYHDLNQPFQIGATTIQPIEVFHPSPCLAYRFEHGGKVFVFCTDHELRRGNDPNHPRQVASLEAEKRLRAHSMDADVLYRDGQFLEIEYDGHMGIEAPFGVSRLDWGHSTIEDVLDMAEQCRIKHTYIGHHDPNRNWAERRWLDQILQRKSSQTGLHFELARAETVVDL
jgi:phosphoribosyl 1,2-cyclic phosphodiesterase